MYRFRGAPFCSIKISICADGQLVDKVAFDYLNRNLNQGDSSESKTRALIPSGAGETEPEQIESEQESHCRWAYSAAC